MNSLFRLLGQMTDQKGRAAEARALEALTASPPEWLISARAASKEEDARGIDIVVQTSDLGILFLQVKSSEHRIAAFRRKYPRLRCAVVVVRNQGPKRLRREVLRALEALRVTLSG